MEGQADIRYVSDAAGNPVAVIVPIDLWREIESERETAYLLKSEAMRQRLSSAEQELESFTQFAKARLRAGNPESSLDGLFDLWRIEHPPDTDYAEDGAALRDAIHDFRRGDRGRLAGELSR